MDKNKIIEGVKDLLDEGQQDDRILMDGFFNLLFWRDYKDGHVKCGDRGRIFEEIKKATKTDFYGEDRSVHLDVDKILPFINKLRVQLGLLELCSTLIFNDLVEMTPEVKKELILKELKK